MVILKSVLLCRQPPNPALHRTLDGAAELSR
jgi:hypothetical protein